MHMYQTARTGMAMAAYATTLFLFPCMQRGSPTTTWLPMPLIGAPLFASTTTYKHKR